MSQPAGSVTVTVVPPGAGARRHDIAAVQLRDVAHDRRAEPEAALRRRECAFGPAERLEQVRQVFRRNALPRIGDRQPHALACPGQRHDDAPARRRELDRIRQQVRQELARARGPPESRRSASRSGSTARARLGRRVEFAWHRARSARDRPARARGATGRSRAKTHRAGRPPCATATARCDRSRRRPVARVPARRRCASTSRRSRSAACAVRATPWPAVRPSSRFDVSAWARASRAPRSNAGCAARRGAFAHRAASSAGPCSCLRIDHRRRGEGRPKTAAVASHCTSSGPTGACRFANDAGNGWRRNQRGAIIAGDVAPGGLRRVDAEDPARGRIPARDPACGIDPDDRVGRRRPHGAAGGRRVPARVRPAPARDAARGHRRRRRHRSRAGDRSRATSQPSRARTPTKLIATNAPACVSSSASGASRHHNMPITATLNAAATSPPPNDVSHAAAAAPA